MKRKGLAVQLVHRGKIEPDENDALPVQPFGNVVVHDRDRHREGRVVSPRAGAEKDSRRGRKVEPFQIGHSDARPIRHRDHSGRADKRLQADRIDRRPSVIVMERGVGVRAGVHAQAKLTNIHRRRRLASSTSS